MSGPATRLERARALDAEAIAVGEDGPRGRELRTQAAALRVEAVGERVYPVVVCTSCFRLTGWTTAAGSCDACARHAARRAAEAGAGGWGSAAAQAPFPQPLTAPALPLGVRLAASIGARGALHAALARAWREHVEPGDTGPIDPEPGYEVEGAVRDEIERLDGSGVLVRFATATHRFAAGGWERLPSTRIGRSLLPNPAEFAADLEVAMLVEAWGDYQAAVAAINRATWNALAERREAERLGRAARSEALHAQEHTAELLKE